MATKKCPRCRVFSMKSAGTIRGGPRGGLRRVYQCKICGYRSMK